MRAGWPVGECIERRGVPAPSLRSHTDLLVLEERMGRSREDRTYTLRIGRRIAPPRHLLLLLTYFILLTWALLHSSALKGSVTPIIVLVLEDWCAGMHSESFLG